MKRIRYKNESGLLVSNTLMADLNEITLILDPAKLELTLRLNGEVVSTGKAVSVQMLKKRAKEFAIQMGVKFEDEVRPRVKL